MSKNTLKVRSNTMSVRVLTRNALLTALVAVATLTIRIPMPATQGYLNLGDGGIFVAALVFGPRTGLVAGGVGSSLADLLGGYPHWAPFTLVIKGFEGFLVGIVFQWALPHRWRAISAILGSCLGGAWMVAGYFVTETFMYGWQPALAAFSGNLMQALGSIVVGVPVALSLIRAGLGVVEREHK
jgi:uncharacterized membrane protein